MANAKTDELSHLIGYLKKNSDVITRLAPEAFRHLKGEFVHKLRVAIRRTRTSLWLLRYSSSDIRIKELDSKLRALAKALGKVRELDVAILDAKQYDVDSAQLKAHLKTAQKKLRKLLKKKKRDRLKQQLSIAANATRQKMPISLKKARSKLSVKLNKQLSLNLKKKKSFHQIRIVLKKSRYALEAMEKPVDHMKQLQDILGKAHDLELLQKLTSQDDKIKKEQRLLNKKAIHLVKPVLQFALRQFTEGTLG